MWTDHTTVTRLVQLLVYPAHINPDLTFMQKYNYLLNTDVELVIDNVIAASRHGSRMYFEQ